MGKHDLLFILFEKPNLVKPSLNGNYHSSELVIDDKKRTFSYYLPKNLKNNPSIVFVLHGTSMTGERMRQYTQFRFDQIADNDSFIVVYPDAYKKNWHCARTVPKDAAHNENINDVAFIENIIEILHRDYSINREEVYATGYSNGGHMCTKLALSIPEKIKSIALIASQVPGKGNFFFSGNPEPISVMQINGTLDKINPFEGGDVNIFGIIHKGVILSAEESINYWLKVNGLQSVEPTIEKKPNSTNNGVECYNWTKNVTEVRWYKINGGGHTIPGGLKLLKMLGKTNMEVMAADEICKFFRL